MPPGNGVHVIQGEIAMVVSSMRRNARWSPGTREEPDPILHSFATLKQQLATVEDLCTEDVNEFLAPFLEVVRSEVTTGPITGVALSSVNKILSYGLIEPGMAHAASGIENIADAVTHAKFVGTDLASDEVVLMKILQVLRTLMLSPVGTYMSNESVCEVMQSCFRICFETRLSELLRRTAEQTLTDMLLMLFSRLGELKEPSNQAQGSNPQIKAPIKSESDEEETADSQENAPNEELETSAADILVPPTTAQSRTNARGVRFQQKHEHDGPLVPYGVPCIQELLRFLNSLINTQDRHNTETMIGMGLSMLTVALEAGGGQALSKFPSVLSLLADETCRNLFRLLQSESLTVFAATLRIFFLLFESQRTRLKFQLAKFLSELEEMDYRSYEHKEIALDCILQLCHLPYLSADLFLNFDVNLHCNDVFSKLVKFLSENSFPDGKQLFTTHLIALDALLTMVKEIETRGERGLSTTPPRPVIKQTLVPPHAAVAAEKVLKLPEASELPVLKEKKALLQEGVNIFNESPRKGIAFLQEKKLLSEDLTPVEIAAFFRSDPRLDKAKIGEYIGHPKHVPTLQAFVDSFRFHDKTLDEALRAFLSAFRLPGEAQIIERILENFADAWHRTYTGERVVADRDATFVLSYAIILLNVDQHNPKNKKPMKLSDFLRNQRGLNNGIDFPPEFLESIYNAIKSKEIVLPQEREGELKEDYEWKMMLSRSEEPQSVMISAKGNTSYDRDVFLQVWGPTVTALSSVWDSTVDDHTVTKVITAFESCARICGRFVLSDVFDNIIIALCKRTLLSSKSVAEYTRAMRGNGTEDTVVTAFAQHTPAQVATKATFKLARQHGDILREGWTNILDCVRTLFITRLLPPSIMMMEDFLADDGKSPLTPVRKKAAVRSDSSLLSTLSSFLMNSNPEPEPYEEELVPDSELMTIAKEHVAECHIEDLFEDTKFLQNESLHELMKALRFMSKMPDAAADATRGSLQAGYDEYVAIFFLEILCNIVLRNKDRISVLWDPVQHHLETLISKSEKEQMLTDRAIVNLVRLCLRLLRKEEIAPQLLQALQQLGSVDEAVQSRSLLHVSAALGSLIKTNASHIEQAQGWDVILSLVQLTRKDHLCIPHSCDVMELIVITNNLVTPANFKVVMDTVISFQETIQGEPHNDDGSYAAVVKHVPAGLHDDSATPAPDVLVATRVVDLLHALHAQVLTIHSKVDPSGLALWKEYWKPLLQSMVQLCSDHRKGLRQSALTALQRALLLPDLDDKMTEAEWKECLEDVLFPLMERLLTVPTTHGRVVLEEVRMRSCTLLCKVFLQHLHALLSLQDFTGLWLKMLDYMDKYMHADNSDLLLEAVPESLKNMLLVMSTGGIFKPPGDEPQVAGQSGQLWELTWTRIGTFLPNLHSELFPDSAPPPVVPVVEEPPPVSSDAPTDAVVVPQPDSAGLRPGTPPQPSQLSSSAPNSPMRRLADVSQTNSAPTSPHRPVPPDSNQDDDDQAGLHPHPIIV